MKSNITYSLSLQKQISKQSVAFDTEINQAFNDINLRSLTRQSNIIKKRGFDTVSLLFLYLLLPFLKRKVSDYWNSQYLQNHVDACKDTFYRFLNHERFNWRRLVYLIALRIIARSKDVLLKDKVLIADDTVTAKSGKEIELISYHRDHKTKRSILGTQFLQLGFHDGSHFFPIDGAFHTSKHRPNTKMRDIDKRTNGWKRRTEALSKKTDILVQMADRANKAGIDAAFMLFDSWFAHDDTISRIYKTGYNVICRLKKNRVKYDYQGEQYTLKQLWQKVAKKKTQWIDGQQLKGVCLNVTLPKTDLVRILFVSDGRKDWQVLLCTDIYQKPDEIIEYYARRWSIEVYFKDAKQLFYMGKDQSNNFDALVAANSLVMIRYLLIVYILSKRRLEGPIGPLFRQESDRQTFSVFAKAIWDNIKELIFRSSDILSYQIDLDILFHVIDIIENTIIGQIPFLTAKL
jgi:hypothetical protein